MDFFVKKTNEMTDLELQQLLDLFNKVFEKDRPMEVMLNQYTQNPFGYSYHSYFVDEGKIQGAITYIPAYFYYGNEKKVFVNSVDTMIAKEYRDLYELLELLNNGYQALKENGVALAYGYPNENSLMVYVKSKTMSSIGKMRIYGLPYRIGGIKAGLKFLNPLSLLFSWCYVEIASLLASKKEADFMIYKEQDSYNETRYKRLDSDYGVVRIKDFTLYYKIREQEGVRTAFIIDIDKKSSCNFCKAVKYLLKCERNNFDLILYPGYLPFKVTGMICIPRKYEPKNFHFAAKILDKNLDKKEVLNIENWDTNLSNYDLI